MYLSQTYKKENLPSIDSRLTELQHKRVESDEDVLTRIDSVAEEIYSAINEDRKNQEDEEQSLFAMLSELVDEIKKEIKGFSSNRKACEVTILQLIDKANEKLNSIQSEV